MSSIELGAATKPTKQEKSKWTPAEESTLIDLVLCEEERLFGPLKGAGFESVRKLRQSIWQKLTDELNSRFCNEKRDVPAIKKKYANIKQRAKEKLDIKRKDARKTGGGPEAPSCTPAEEALLQVMHDRPVMIGFSGIDSDAHGESTAAAVADMGDENPKVKENDCPEPPVAAPEESSHSVTTDTKKRRKLTIKEKIDIANLKNIDLDNIRLDNEITNQKLTNEKLKLEISMLQHKKVHYQLKLQSEFNITVQTEE